MSARLAEALPIASKFGFSLMLSIAFWIRLAESGARIATHLKPNALTLWSWLVVITCCADPLELPVGVATVVELIAPEGKEME